MKVGIRAHELDQASGRDLPWGISVAGLRRDIGADLGPERLRVSEQDETGTCLEDLLQPRQTQVVVTPVAAADGRAAPERLRALAEAVERYFIDREGGCLMGNLALEIGQSIPEFAAAIRAYFDEWRRVLVGLLSDHYTPARAAELADDAVARLQGAVMLMGVYGDPSFLRRAVRDTADLLAADKAEAA